MIQFFVDNIEIALSKDFSFNQIDENPIITDAGEFTLDMTISLKIGSNALAFGFVNRVNKRDIPEHWPATLIVNNKISHGKALYLSNTDETVTVQYVSGNSELKYYASKETKIWRLNWGSISELSYTIARDSIRQQGYSRSGYNFVCAPISLNGVIVNNFTLSDESGPLPSNPFQINGVTGDIVMMPYLLYYVEKLPEVLGFTLGENVLIDNERAKRMYLINHVRSYNYAQALPDITVGEFIEIIEDSFNVVFIVDKIHKTLDIQYRSKFIAELPIVQLDNVLDAYTRNDLENTDDVLNRFSVNRFVYPISDSDYFKYHCISDRVMNKIIQVPRSSFASLKDFLTAYPEHGWNKNLLFTTTDPDEISVSFWLYGDNPGVDLFSREISPGRNVFLVNKFTDSSFGAYADPMEIRLVPPAMEKAVIVAKQNPNTEGFKNFDVIYQMPASSYDLENSEIDIALIGLTAVELIEEGAEDMKRSTTLDTAIYMGEIKAFIMSGTDEIKFDVYYPFSCNDVWPDFAVDPGDSNTSRFENWANYFNTFDFGSYRLKEYKKIYSNNDVFYTDKEYVFKLEDSPLLTTRFLFKINYAVYIPIRFERNISAKRDFVTGYFYKMK